MEMLQPTVCDAFYEDILSSVSSDVLCATPNLPGAMVFLDDEMSRDSGLGSEEEIFTDSEPELSASWNHHFTEDVQSPQHDSTDTALDFTSFSELIKRPTCSGHLSDIGTISGQKRSRPDIDDFMSETPVLKRHRILPTRSERLDVLFSTAVLNYENEDLIKSALDRVSEDSDLVGDGSKTCCLPTIPGKHQDLKSISPETLAKVLDHEYDHVIENFVIVDCRYPYEYQGGHIRGAKNYHTRETIIENLVNNPLRSTDNSKRTVLIFHCEFSSERGPKMCRFLRSVDRDCNKESYPELFYPEVYVLHGGYHNFFENQKELCHPKTYMPMKQDDYTEDKRKFRFRSKSFPGETKRLLMRRGIKF